MILIYKKCFSELIAKYTNLEKEQVLSVIEIPPFNVPGDLAFPCFSLSKLLKKSPQELAQELLIKIIEDESFKHLFENIQVVGGFLNIFVKSDILANDVLKNILLEKENYGAGTKKDETILVESPGPNTNKPLHLGHVRNMLLGNALENILKFAGYDVKRVDIVNDRGIHICKSMLAYQKFGNDALPTKKSDHFVGDRYVEYAKQIASHPEIEEEIKNMLVLWESGDPQVKSLRKKMNTWAIDGMKQTYKRYGCEIDKAYYESEHYLTGKDIIEKALEQGIFQKNVKGNIVFKIGEEEKVVLRADGTSIYLTQDLALAGIRFQDFAMSRMIYVVANEQEDHFKALFAILKALGYQFADKCYHMSYGMISLPSGKMKSREGTVVDADLLADDMFTVAKEELEKRYPEMTQDEILKKAEIIAMGAIKFFIIKYDVSKNFVFDPKESLSFEGETGPYMQYAYARCCSILGKAEYEGGLDIANVSLLKEQEEKDVLLKLAEFPEVVSLASIQYKPNLIARYVLELVKSFNTYYQNHKIIQEDKNLQDARLSLVACVKQVLGNALGLLGIGVLEKM